MKSTQAHSLSSLNHPPSCVIFIMKPGVINTVRIVRLSLSDYHIIGLKIAIFNKNISANIYVL